MQEGTDEAQLQEAELDLCIWYFSLYGPASFKDYQWWAGLAPVARLRRPFRMLQAGMLRPGMQAPHGPHFRLVQVQVQGMQEALFMLEAQLPALLATSDAAITGMARLLPYEDALIKAYKETRYRFYPTFRHGGQADTPAPAPTPRRSARGKGKGKDKDKDQYRGRDKGEVTTSGQAPDISGFSEAAAIVRGEAMPTVWLDGCIVGVWKWRNKPQHPLAVTMMVEPTEQQRRLLDVELQRLHTLVQHSAVEWH